VANRGQAHSTYGQGLVGGLLIESRSLRTIHSISEDGADVDAGVLWQELLLAAGEHGLTPPVLTRFTGPGRSAETLSVGGVGVRTSTAPRSTWCAKLEVCDGRGPRAAMLGAPQQALFEAMLGGLGQVRGDHPRHG